MTRKSRSLTIELIWSSEEKNKSDFESVLLSESAMRRIKDKRLLSVEAGGEDEDEGGEDEGGAEGRDEEMDDADADADEDEGDGREETDDEDAGEEEEERREGTEDEDDDGAAEGEEENASWRCVPRTDARVVKAADALRC